MLLVGRSHSVALELFRISCLWEQMLSLFKLSQGRKKLSILAFDTHMHKHTYHISRAKQDSHTHKPVASILEKESPTHPDVCSLLSPQKISPMGVLGKLQNSNVAKCGTVPQFCHALTTTCSATVTKSIP